MKQNKALICCTGIEFVQLICYFRIHKMQVFSLFLKKGVTLYLLRYICSPTDNFPVFAIFIIFAKHIIFNTLMQNY